MSVYLVPCACGQKTPVDRSRAGMTVQCACGAPIEVPSLGKLSRLEQLSPKESAEIAPPAVRPRASAGERQAVLCGAFAILLGIATGLVLLSQPVVPPELLRAATTPQEMHDHMLDPNPTLVESLETFSEFKQTGLDPQGLFGYIDEIELRQRRYHRAAQILGGLGVVLLVACGVLAWSGKRPAATA